MKMFSIEQSVYAFAFIVFSRYNKNVVEKGGNIFLL